MNRGWNCDGCGNSNFSWRKTCKKCNAPKSQALKDAEKAATGGWLTAGLSDTSNRIFVKGFAPLSVTTIDTRQGALFPSDHYPVVAVLRRR